MEYIFIFFVLFGVVVSCGDQGSKSTSNRGTVETNSSTGGASPTPVPSSSSSATTTPGASGSPTSTPTPVSYSTQISPIVSANCLSCHNGGQLPNLSNLTGVKTNIDNVITDITSGTMPKFASPLSASQISLFSQWKAGNYAP